MDHRLESSRFPRSSRYHPEWIIAGASGGANSLWLTEWLSDALEMRPGMQVLDLGCGRGVSSIFLRREFGVSVWSADLWSDVSERQRRIRAAGVADGVFAMRADARALPFAADFFDAVVCIDAYPYFGTDDGYLGYLARFLKPGGAIAVAGAGLLQEIDGPVPSHLQSWWTPDLWCLHSAGWWRRHWERTGIVDIEVADAMPEGWERWLEWQRAVAPGNLVEIAAVDADRGRCLGYVRIVGRRRAGVVLAEPITAIPAEYRDVPLLRDPA